MGIIFARLISGEWEMKMKIMSLKRRVKNENERSVAWFCFTWLVEGSSCTMPL